MPTRQFCIASLARSCLLSESHRRYDRNDREGSPAIRADYEHWLSTLPTERVKKDP